MRPNSVSAEDWRCALEQRAITQVIAQVFPCRVVFAEPLSKILRGVGDTDLSQWIDGDDEQSYNAAFRLEAGAVDLSIRGSPTLRQSFFAACDFLKIDARFRWSRASEAVPEHCLVKLGQPEEANLAKGDLPMPAPLVIAGDKTELTLQVSHHTKSVRDLRHVIAPGSILIRRSDARAVEPIVWRDAKGEIPHYSQELQPTSPSVTPFQALIQAFAFAVVREAIQREEGKEGETCAKFLTGWLARTVREAEGAKTSPKLFGVICAITADIDAIRLIEFVKPGPSAVYLYQAARAKLKLNPDTPTVAGKHALREWLGAEAERNFRLACFAGLDITPIDLMADQYIQNKDSGGGYIDRHAFKANQGKWEFFSRELLEWNREKKMLFGNKEVEVFRLFSASDLKVKVDHTIFSPLHPAGQVLRYVNGRVISNDDDKTQGSLVFNAWGGLPVKPIHTVDASLMRECDERLERLLFGLTRDNRSQADWIKRWLAWTLQHPAEKQQVALILFGGQNIGKSFFGVRFLPAIFRHLAGTAEGDNLNEQFWVAPYLNKLVVFLDEAVFRERASVERAKRLIRNVQIAGEQKGQDPRQYDVYARLVLASNRKNIGLGSDNLYDRGFFPVLGDGPEYNGMTETEFQIRRIEANGDFFEEYDAFLQRPIVQAHYVRMFLDMPVRKGEVEDLSQSSAADWEILMANLSAAKQVAKELLESGTFTLDTRDMMEPFSREEFFKRAAALARDMGGRRPASAAHVWNELAVLELFEPAGTKWKLRYEREEVFRQVEKAWGVKLARAKPVYGDHRG